MVEVQWQNFNSRIVVSILFLGIIIFVVVDVFVVSEEPYNLVPASGIITYILLFYIFSHNPARVRYIMFSNYLFENDQLV